MLAGNLAFPFYHPKLLAEVYRQVSRCDICQCMKRRSRQYGLLAPCAAKSIGPWVIGLCGGHDYSLCALTMIDIMTNLLEIEPIVIQTAAECARAFENGWLSRYPRPVCVIHDQGSEFMGSAFQDLLHRAGIKSVPMMARNPQGNSIIEAFHKSVGQVLRTLVHIHRLQTVHQAKSTGDTTLATATHAMQCASHQALHHLTPGSFAFCHDMFVDLPFLTDILALQNTWQHLVDTRLLHENAAQISHDYQVSTQVLKKLVLLLSSKLKPSFTSPHDITQVHTNGTIAIHLLDNVTKHINIRWIKPYRSRFLSWKRRVNQSTYIFYTFSICSGF